MESENFGYQLVGQSVKLKTALGNIRGIVVAVLYTQVGVLFQVAYDYDADKNQPRLTWIRRKEIIVDELAAMAAEVEQMAEAATARLEQGR